MMFNKLKTVSTKVQGAININNVCEEILNVLIEAGTGLEASEIMRRFKTPQFTSEGYKVTSINSYLKFLRNLGLVEREVIGTKVIEIERKYSAWDYSREDKMYVNGELFIREGAMKTRIEHPVYTKVVDVAIYKLK